MITHSKGPDTRVITLDDWLKEGDAIFGTNLDDWKFVCPMCGNIQSVADFRKLHEQGHKVEPSSSYFNCIGRYIGGRSAFFDDGKKGPPCDYTMGGLFCVANTYVVTEGKEHPVFEFYREASVEQENKS